MDGVGWFVEDEERRRASFAVACSAEMGGIEKGRMDRGWGRIKWNNNKSSVIISS